jgi:hypothetical protein
VAQLEAVFFDMDGTLVDSEKVWSVGLDELTARYGGTLSERPVVGSTARVHQPRDGLLAFPSRDPGPGPSGWSVSVAGRVVGWAGGSVPVDGRRGWAVPPLG